jgi:hypothetical protein
MLPQIGKSQFFHIRMDTLIKNDSIINYSIIEDKNIVYKKLSTKNRQILINHIPLDSSGIRLWSLPFLHEKNIYFNAMHKADNNYKHLAYSIPNMQIKNFNFDFLYDDGLSCSYKIDNRNAKIYQFNLRTEEQTLFVDFWDVVRKAIYADNKEGSEEDIWQVFFIDANYVFVSLCYNDGSQGDGCTQMRYFTSRNGTNLDITNKIYPKTNSDERVSTCEAFVKFVSSDGKYIKDDCDFGIYNYEKRTSRYGNINRLFDSNFNYISNLLYLKSNVEGVNIQNNKIKHYFLETSIDTKDSTVRYISGYADKRVIIPYRFNPQLELSMYKAYENNLLTQNDIKGLEKYELSILRNLIFAKYNYAFKSEFYQAYFNLYEFYGNKDARISRVKDVSNKLTEADKANIKLIQDAESKLIKK